jgi:hypothetical protein
MASVLRAHAFQYAKGSAIAYATIPGLPARLASGELLACAGRSGVAGCRPG